MDTTLVVLAAGIGSRFGKGIKQLEPVGPGGEIIMDYSIHDALEAGFNRVVFIIRHDLYDDFYEMIGRRMEKSAPLPMHFRKRPTCRRVSPARRNAKSLSEPGTRCLPAAAL